jgi:hypothetical protein
MNLPVFNPLLLDQSTYITFTKSLLDLDKADNNGTGYYFSKMVALNLPQYNVPDFWLDLSSMGVISDSPNTVIPKGMQYYMENIIRQNVGTERVTELAFYKFLNKCGMSYADIHASVVFINKVATSNFITVENNGGWGEIVGVVPNRSGLLNKVWKTLNEVPNIVTSDLSNDQGGLFDTGNKEFNFNDPLTKQVIDFDLTTNDTEVANQQFDFNVLLFFYQDSTGVDKLHGINFIAPFENKITYWDLPTYTQKTNDARSIGYQFKLNLKTCTNEASLVQVQDYNSDGSHWNTYFDTLSKLNSFLTLNMLGKSPIG